MKTFGLILIVAGFALAAVPASAQETGATSFTLETHTEGGGGYFQLEGQTARNPRLVVPASTEITVTLKGMDDGVHNIQVAGSSASEFVTAAGETVTYTFTSPASGTVEYWCVPHKGAGMKGTVAVAGSEPTTGTPPADGGNDTPGVQIVGVAIAMLGAALIIGRRSK